ncbi:MAG: aminotransferase class I/II-fold pyridoxal phosphate-dependent enzyme [Christensenellales bacterium]|jgi:cystathionine beta-lyase family protein involved in aluminum resistance
MSYSDKAIKIINDAEKKLNFDLIDGTALYNQSKVLDAFRKHKVSYRHFAPTNGYGYGDEGRDVLNKVFAEVFRAEDALVSPYIASGTHALSLMLQGLLRPGDTLLNISGKPYDTLNNVISGKNVNSLEDYGVIYRRIALIDGKFDKDLITRSLDNVKMVFITRSKGYEWRNANSIEDILSICKLIKSVNPSVIIAVDNCYGEFVASIEPVEAGADIIAGSLIKNAGGGLAPSGGYIAGKKNLIEQVAYRLTAPGIGAEIGSYMYGYQLFYQGLFMAPVTVKNALMTGMLFGRAFSDIGLETMPGADERCHDIIRAIKFPDKESLIDFCRSIQRISPIDSFVTLEPWPMPGYDADVIMAAGTFVAGSSIELSADSPIKEPFAAYIQGALTYEHGKLAALHCIDKYLSRNNIV